MEKKIIKTDRAPAAIGPYEQAIGVGGFLFTSGQIALDPTTGIFLEGSIEEETERVIQNLEGILTEAGLTLKDVVKTTVYLTDLGHFGRVKRIKAGCLKSGFYPFQATDRNCIIALFAKQAMSTAGSDSVLFEEELFVAIV